MQIIGHRGAKGLAPENTVAGIRAALKRQVDWIEFDVRVTHDGALVVVHDRTLLRIAKQLHKVRHYTLAQLKAIATQSGEPIPTFEEIMAAIGTKAKIDIELKEKGAAPQVIAEVNRQVAAGRSYDDFLVTSLRPRLLREMQRLEPRIHVGLLQGAWPLAFLTLPGLRLSAVGFYHLVAPRAAIKLAKRAGLWTFVFTVNQRTEATHFEQLGVDALITDVPQQFKPLWPWLLGSLAAGLVVASLFAVIAYFLWQVLHL